MQSRSPHSRGLPCRGFFSPQLLEGTRLLVLQGERVANPDFYPMLRSLGFSNLPDQSTMGAITFSDVVVSHEPFSMGCCFTNSSTWNSIGNSAFHGFLNFTCADF